MLFRLKNLFLVIVKITAVVVILIILNLVAKEYNSTVIDLNQQTTPKLENVVLYIPSHKIDKITMTSPEGITSVITQKNKQFILENVSLEQNKLYQESIDVLVRTFNNLTFIDKIADTANLDYDYSQTYLLEVITKDGLIFEIDAFPYKSGYWITIALDTTNDAKASVKTFKENNYTQFNNQAYRIPIEEIRPLMTNLQY